MISHEPGNAATERAGFYGFGWNVNYDDEGRVRLNHSGGFDLGAATVVNLVPSGSGDCGAEQRDADRSAGSARHDVFAFTERKRLVRLQARVQRSKPRTAGGGLSRAGEHKTPALANAAYTGTCGNDLYGDVEVAEGTGAGAKMGPSIVPMKHRDRTCFVRRREMAAGLHGDVYGRRGSEGDTSGDREFEC